MLADLFSLPILIPLVFGLMGSFWVEYLLQPKTRPFWQRNWSAWFIHTGLCLLLFAAVLIIFRRPWFSVVFVLAFLLLVVQVSNAKFHSLREPFIYQDIEYFTDAIKYPRLYLPFLGVGRAVIVVIGFVVAVYAGLSLESALTVSISSNKFLVMVSALILLSGVLLCFGDSQKLAVLFDPQEDLYRLGLMTCLWRYYQEEQTSHHFASLYDFLEPTAEPFLEKPNLVVVQSESFFDVRRLFSGVRTEVLQAFDALQSNALVQGQLAVSAWGANTVRTEFAFLSGLASSMLGVHRFNPYRKLAQQGVPNLVSYLKSLGYHTICVHPYQAGFYARDKVFPKLGFDRFIDIKSFNDNEKSGPYIGDVALAEKVCNLLKTASVKPVFVFVITMENHGPLHLEKKLVADEGSLYSIVPKEGCDDLTIYLRHLRNADRMAGLLRNCMEELSKKSFLCWYGDHVPIMPDVYKVMGEPEGKTDYFIWTNDSKSTSNNLLNLNVENLGVLLLQKMGLISIHF
jgi:phosphoglycerol transferase MdoB-like AlkP superfamily enzyme